MSKPLLLYRVSVSEHFVWHIDLAACDHDDAIERANEMYTSDSQSLRDKFEINMERGGTEMDAELLDQQEDTL